MWTSMQVSEDETVNSFLINSLYEHSKPILKLQIVREEL